MASRARYAAQRQLETNATTSRITGGVSLVIGLLALCLLDLSRAGAPLLLIYFGFLALLFYGPGAIYLIFADRVKRGVSWAIITTLVIAALQALAALAFFVIYALVFFLLGAALMAILLLLLVVLIIHCSKGLSAVRTLGPTTPGFEPLMPLNPVVPPVQLAPPPRPAQHTTDWPDIR